MLVHGSLDRSAGMLKLSRRLDDRFRVLRYDRRGYGRSAPHDGPFAMDEQVADLVDVLGGAAAPSCSATATAATSPSPWPTATRDLVRAVGVYETPLSWVDWWPTAPRPADSRGRLGEHGIDPRRRPPSGSCAG